MRFLEHVFGDYLPAEKETSEQLILKSLSRNMFSQEMRLKSLLNLIQSLRMFPCQMNAYRKQVHFFYGSMQYAYFLCIYILSGTQHDSLGCPVQVQELDFSVHCGSLPTQDVLRLIKCCWFGITSLSN